MTPRGIITSIWAFAVALLLACSPSLGGYRDLIGYPELYDLLEPDVPTGADVPVTQVEGLFEGGYMPNTSHSEFSGKTFDNDTNSSSVSSSHATQVGQNFYGNSTSIAPGILEITNFELEDWLDDGFLKRTSEVKPDWSISRIANHSWAWDIGDDNRAVLLRLDFVVETDDYIQVIGVSNEPELEPLLADSYNAIAVGRTDAVHAKGTTSPGSPYVSGRIKPDLVAPGFSPSNSSVRTSWGAPMVTASAALLVETGHKNPGLSNYSYYVSERSGETIYYAETSEVIKAGLMAGADRRTHNFRGAEISDYVVDTSNGLDSRFGAGQVNIFNSYKIISGGEHDSFEDLEITDIGQYGFDYDPEFGGSGSNSMASYFFDAAGNDFLMACLAWNLDIAGGTESDFDPEATFYDLDLLLYDVTSGTSLVGSSASSNDNTENLYERLTIGHRYKLEVSPGDEQGDFLWDYGLAWQLAPVLPGDVNGDGWVSDADLSIVIAHWGQSTVLGPEYGDLNGNGIVDGPDYSEVISYWDTGIPPPFKPSEAIAATPEPATVWLMILVGTILARQKRKQ